MVNLISFKKEQLQEVLNLLDIRAKIIPELQIEIILNNENKQAKCETCGKKLTMNNLGSIAKGSEDFNKPNLLYCENPACFATKLAEKF